MDFLAPPMDASTLRLPFGLLELFPDLENFGGSNSESCNAYS